MKAIFTRAFDWRRPNSRYSFHVEPAPQPQLKPHDVIAAAIAAGAATPVPDPKQQIDAPAGRGKQERTAP